MAIITLLGTLFVSELKKLPYKIQPTIVLIKNILKYEIKGLIINYVIITNLYSMICMRHVGMSCNIYNLGWLAWLHGVIVIYINKRSYL